MRIQQCALNHELSVTDIYLYTKRFGRCYALELKEKECISHYNYLFDKPNVSFHPIENFSTVRFAAWAVRSQIIHVRCSTHALPTTGLQWCQRSGIFPYINV